jgi:hypothetical protein
MLRWLTNSVTDRLTGSSCYQGVRSSPERGLGARVVVFGDEAGNAVLLNDDVLVAMSDHLFDLDVFVTIREKEMSSVLPDSFVLRQGQRQALEAAAGRTFTDELERLSSIKLARKAPDVLIERPEQRFVLRETLLPVFIHLRLG